MIRGRLEVLVQPQVEPVSLAEIYSWLHLDPEGSPPTHPDDAMLSSLIRAGRQYVEKATRRSLVWQTIRYTMIDEPPYQGPANPFPLWGQQIGWQQLQPNGPWNRIELFRPPVIAVAQVAQQNADGTLSVIDPATYRVVTTGAQVAFIETAAGAWPTGGIAGSGLVVDYVAGYLGTGSPPDLTDSVPEDLKTAIKLWVQKVYDPLTPDQQAAYDKTIDCICSTNQVYSF